MTSDVSEERQADPDPDPDPAEPGRARADAAAVLGLYGPGGLGGLGDPGGSAAGRSLGRRLWDAAADRLTARDRAILGLWALAHVALLVLSWTATWTQSTTNAHLPMLGYQHWDTNHYVSIAEHGYFGPGAGKNDAAFFPGYPLALAMTHAVIPDWTAAELVLSAAAGAVALVALGRLAGDSRAALYLLCAPASVFLFVGYSESLFLALAVPAWLAARRHDWVLTSWLAYGAAFVRVDGLFLLPALALMAITNERRGSRLQPLLLLAVSCCAPAGYFGYLHAHTGRWTAWFDANQAGWGLHYVGFAKSLRTSYWSAFEHPYNAGFSFMEQLEIGCLFAIALGTLALLAARRWPESVYCGLAVVTLGTSTWYQSVPRTLLLMFPIWTLLARAAGRWPAVGRTYIWASAPLAVTVAIMFLSGRWAG